MKTRILTGAITGILVLFLIFSHITVFDIAFITIASVMMFELLLAGKVNRTSIIVNVVATIICIYIGIYHSSYIQYSIPVYIIIILTLHIFTHTKFSTDKLFYTIFCFTYVNILFPYVAQIKHSTNGSLMLLMFAASVVFSDTGAYFVGVTLGKHKLCPNISPKKTIEGSVGAFLGSVLATLVVCFIYSNFLDIQLSYLYSAIYAVICGGLSQIGDLTASSIKRYFDIKDYGNVLPGHGGLMDRLDSVIFVAPVFYFFLINFICV